MKKPARKTVLLVQLPVLPQVVYGPTGNSALAAGCLAAAALTAGLGGSCDITVMAPEEVDMVGDQALIELLCQRAPDILCFSLYLWNSERSLYVARKVRDKLPDMQVVVGGPEVVQDNTFLIDHEGFDIAVTGEGEKSFAQVLRLLLSRRNPRELPGVAARCAGRLSKFSISDHDLPQLADYPSPYLTGILPVEAGRSVYMETARGCVSRCSFCFYSRGHATVRRLEPDNIERLLSGLIEHGAKDISILDPSFNRRPDFQTVLKRIGRLNASRQLSFFAEINADSVNEAEIGLLAAAGFGKIEVGLQSINRKTIARAGRKGDPVEIVRKACLMKKHGIEPLVDLIIGLPGDSKKDFLRGVRYLCDHGLGEFMQFLPLAVLPGTALRRNAKKEGLVFDTFPPYRIISTPLMTESDIEDSITSAESIIGGRVDEYPRPFLCLAQGIGKYTDTLFVDLDDERGRMAAVAKAAFASHFSVWFKAADLFGRVKLMQTIIKDIVEREPHSIMDIVLSVRTEFPLDVIDMVRDSLANGSPNYLTRHHSIHGENLARRIACVISAGSRLDKSFSRALLAEVSVYEDMSAAAALRNAGRLGVTLPCARITEEFLPGGTIQKNLAARLDGEAVTFASRELEKWWVLNALGYKD